MRCRDTLPESNRLTPEDRPKPQKGGKWSRNSQFSGAFAVRFRVRVLQKTDWVAKMQNLHLMRLEQFGETKLPNAVKDEISLTKLIFSSEIDMIHMYISISI